MHPSACRWLQAYLAAKNPMKTASVPPAQQGAEQARNVGIEEEQQNHSTALIKASCENNALHVEFWMSIRGKCAIMDKKETRPNYKGWTCVHYAVLNNNPVLTRTLLEAGADVDAADEYGLTPMMIAAYMGHVAIVEVLLDFTVRLDCLSYNDKSPMEPGCGSASKEETLKFGHMALQWALEKYGDEGAQWSCYHPMLTDAEENRIKAKSEIAQVILEHGGDADHISATGLSAWHMACMLPGFTVCAEQLKTYGRYLSSDRFPAAELLCLAATQGNIPMLAFLRNQEFAIDSRNEQDRTALYCAADAGWHETVMWLGEFPKNAELGARCTEAKRLPLHAAVANGHLQCVKALAMLGADMEAEEGAGCTPLHTGAQCGHGDVVDHLISMGVNVNAQDASGATPYVLASAEGHLSICKALCDAGAEHLRADSMGRLGIHTAAACGQLELVEFALHKGAKVDVKDLAGRTAMMLASQNGHFDVVKYLQGRDSEVNEVDGNKQRCLHLAAEAAKLDIVQFLCESGAEPDAVDNWGRTALYLAAKNNHLEIADRLIANGASYDIAVTEREIVDLEGGDDDSKSVAASLQEEAKSVAATDKEEEEEEEEEEEGDEVVGRTALHVAAVGLHVGLVTLLAKGGADVDPEADDGLTPLLTAVRSTTDLDPCYFQCEADFCMSPG